MAGKIISLIRKDFYTLWSEPGIGVSVFLPVIVLSSVAPAWKSLALIFLPIFTLSYGLNTFMLEEKYRTERFFASLAVRRREIVLSRYFGIAVIMAVHLILAYSANFGFYLAGKLKFQLPPGYFSLVLMVVSLLISISFPVYFKYGVTKAMNVISFGIMAAFYALFFAVFKIPGLFEKIRKFSLEDTSIMAFILTGIAILLFAVSISISTKIYSKRDL